VKALIFGVSGQDGYYLTRACLDRGMEVVGIARTPGNWLLGDVASYDFVEEIIRDSQPDLVFHIAANSTTRHQALFEHHRTIGEGTLNVLESVRQWAPSCKVFITGSGLQFVNNGRPIIETDPFDDSSVYSVARNYSVHASRYYRKLGIKTYVGYLFHHESPFRKSCHVSQMIAQAALRIAGGSREMIKLGDITVSKEWTFAGDIAEGIMTLLGQDSIAEAVIGSGKAYSIEDWLDACFEQINRDWRDHVNLHEGFKAEYPILVSNPVKILGLGWRPTVDLTDLAAMMLNEQPML
jgi:GDPmannose 4,6-dehydratase